MCRTAATAVGDFTRDLTSLKPQTRILSEGPFGQLTAATQTHDKVLLVAGGIGITPLRALVEGMTGDIILIYRAMSEDELVFREELEALAKKRNFRIHFVLGDHRLVENRHLLDPAHLRRLVPDIEHRDVYLSGPPGMVEVLRRHLREGGVPAVHIHTEQFALG